MQKNFFMLVKYGQKKLFTDPNGAKRPTDSGWQVELQQEVSLSVIGGAWHYNSAKAALGNKLGIAILPTFTLTEDTVYDAANNEIDKQSFDDGDGFKKRIANMLQKQGYEVVLDYDDNNYVYKITIEE